METNEALSMGRALVHEQSASIFIINSTICDPICETTLVVHHKTYIKMLISFILHSKPKKFGIQKNQLMLLLRKQLNLVSRKSPPRYQIKFSLFP